MARCPGCGNPLPANARFCPLCGTAASQSSGGGDTTLPPDPNRTVQDGRTALPYNPAATNTGAYAAPPGSRGKIALAAGIGAVTVAVALFLLLKATGVLGARKAELPTGTVLTAPRTEPVAAPVLTAPAVAPPDVKAPVLTPPRIQGNPMPEDVIAYLRWLKQFEAARHSLEFRGVAAYLRVPALMTQQMMNAFDENNAGQPQQAPTGANNIGQEIGQVVSKMNEANARFQSYPPPNPCAPLASAYANSLRAKVGQMAKMQVAISQILGMIQNQGNSNQSAQDMLPQLLQEMQTKAMSREADAADMAASQALNSLRGQYTSMPEDVKNWDIKSVDAQLDPKSVIPPGLGFGL